MTTSPIITDCDCVFNLPCGVMVTRWASGSVTLTNTDAPRASIHLTAEEASHLGKLLIGIVRIEPQSSPAERPIGATPT